MFENLFNLGYNMSRSKISVKRLRKLNYKGELIKNVHLKDYTTFKCGGIGKYLLKVKTLENFLAVINYLNSLNVKYFILGAGSNLLVSDNGYDGILIQFAGDLARIEILDDIVECGAGCRLASVITFAKEEGLSGIEDGIGIPASIGGAVYMNASAYDFEMSKVVDYVVAYINEKITYFHNDECKFSYRHSVFQDNNAIILRVGLKLTPQPKEEIELRMKEVMTRRLETQPLNLPSAGCVFKRMSGIVVSKELDNCGLKGLTFGGAKVSERHANFIVNFRNATSQDVYELIEVVKVRMKNKLGIELQTEIKLLGDFDETTG